MADRDDFIGLVNHIERQNANIDGLLDMLEDSDFFKAPASTRFHCAHEGGLVAHSLNVYSMLKSMNKSVYEAFGMTSPYDEDTIRIVSLFHDISKMNYYEPSVRNVKVYKENGSKYDEMGRFDWEAQKSFKVKEPEDRYMLGTHGENSARILSQYIPMTDEEYSAILNHHGAFDNPKIDWTGLANRYSLVQLLHSADCLACYIIEKV